MRLFFSGGREPIPVKEGEFSVERAGLRITFNTQLKNGSVMISANLHNIGNETVKLGSMDLLYITEVYPPVYMNSWQSWLPFKAYARQPNPQPLLDFVQMTGTTPYHLTPIPEVLSAGVFPSDYFVCSRSVLAGFIDSQVSHPYLIWNEAREMLEARVELFGIPLNPGKSVSLESLVVLTGEDPSSMLEKYAAMIKNHKKPILKHREGVGWCSWYNYFEEIDFGELKKNVRIISHLARSGDIPFDLIQLDDGYQADIGDWTVTNSKFPSLDEVSSLIRGHGLKPGIWVAPFSASETSSTFLRHKDWLVKDSRGRPKRAYRNWGKDIFSLDTTNPEVRNSLRKTMTRIRDAGFEYVKIDFLFAGAIPGKRHETAVTPVEAYIKGLEIIKESLGSEVFIVGCGAPLLPSVGFVDAMRIGADTAPSWNSDVPDNGIPSFKNSIRNALTRSFMHEKLWLNDPDTIILRGRDAELSRQEKRMFAMVCGILDNLLLESDDMELVGREDLLILKQALSLRGRYARTFLSGDNDFFIVGAKGSKKPSMIALINLADHERQVSLPQSVFDWLEESPRIQTQKVEPHSIRIYPFEKDT